MKFHGFHKFQIMHEYLDKLSTEQLAEMCRKLYEYVLHNIEDGTQLAISKETGITPPTISRILSKKEIKNKRRQKAHFWNLLNAYQIDFDISTETFSGGCKPSIQLNRPIVPDFIGGPNGNYWMVMVHLQERGKKNSYVGYRYLMLNENGGADFIVGSDEHNDYVGQWSYSASGRQINFQMRINKDESAFKEVNLRFIIGNRTARPKFMAGFMMHSYINDGGVSVFTIFAENISGSGIKPAPEKVPFEKFKITYPEIARFFKQRNTVIHCPSGILNLEMLRLVNDERDEYDEQTRRMQVK